MKINPKNALIMLIIIAHGIPSVVTVLKLFSLLRPSITALACLSVSLTSVLMLAISLVYEDKKPEASRKLSFIGGYLLIASYVTYVSLFCGGMIQVPYKLFPLMFFFLAWGFLIMLMTIALIVQVAREAQGQKPRQTLGEEKV